MKRVWISGWIALLATAGVLAGCAGESEQDADSSSAEERAVRASDYGSAWPLTVDRGVLRCQGEEFVTFTAPDGKTYELNPSPNRDPALREIWKDEGTAKVTIEPLVDTGLEICEEARCGALGVSADARPSGHIVFTSTESGFDLYSIKADGSGSDLRRLAAGPSYELELSPDGSRIAYERGGDLYVIRRDGTDERMLAKDVDEFTWSPNGEWIAVASGTTDVIRADGTRRRTLLGDMSAERLEWASNGELLVGWDAGIYVTQVASGTTRRLAPGRLRGLVAWALSHDGRRVAFAIAATRREIRLINTDGSGFLRLVSDIDSVIDLAWSPDGTHIAVDRITQFAVVAADGSEVSHVGPGTSPRWSSDGRWLGFVASLGTDWPESSEWRNQIHAIDRNGCGQTQVTDEAPLIPADEYAEPPRRDLAWDPRG